jgi:hypothetical protein
VDGIHDHASGLEAAALIRGAYRNLHNLFEKHMLKSAKAARAPSQEHAITLENTTLKHLNDNQNRSKKRSVATKTHDKYANSCD